MYCYLDYPSLTFVSRYSYPICKKPNSLIGKTLILYNLSLLAEREGFDKTLSKALIFSVLMNFFNWIGRKM